MNRKHVVVIGGSVAGMATALALDEHGHRVTVLEKEVLPRCQTAVEAFERWERRGAPQSRHSHAFLARLHNSIRERRPTLYAELMEAGAEQLRFKDMVDEVYEAPEFIPEDDEIVLLACRRITFDWVLRRHLEKHTEIEYRDGVAVEGLEASRDEGSGLPHVTGVRLAASEGDGRAAELLQADLVVDASGRNSKLKHWLAEIGSAPLEEESESCGIFYCSRFYRVRDGVTPPKIEGPIGADLGYMKYAIFPGDSRIFSITLAAERHDEEMRKLRNVEAFEAASATLPATRAWVDPAVSEPVTDVYTYANLKNTLRFFVVEGTPLALGFFPIGDALVHANPISGRGCTLSWLGSYLLADAYAAHPDEPLAFARTLFAGVERELVPWYLNMRDQDRAANERGRMEASGEDPFAFEREDGTIDPKAYMHSLLRDGLLPALVEDLSVLRAFMRVFNMLDAPADILKDPELLMRVMAVWQRRGERDPIRLGPARSEMLEQLKQTAA